MPGEIHLQASPWARRPGHPRLTVDSNRGVPPECPSAQGLPSLMGTSELSAQTPDTTFRRAFHPPCHPQPEHVFSCCCWHVDGTGDWTTGPGVGVGDGRARRAGSESHARRWSRHFILTIRYLAK